MEHLAGAPGSQCARDPRYRRALAERSSAADLSFASTSRSAALTRRTCVGIIPIGTLVLLDTGELAVVLRPATDKEHTERPLVRIIAGASGEHLEPAPEFDLRESNGSGGYVRSIVRLVDNTEYHLETSRWVSST